MTYDNTFIKIDRQVDKPQAVELTFNFQHETDSVRYFQNTDTSQQRNHGEI